MRDLPGFVLHGAPRTKKNSPRIVSLGPMCRACGKRTGFPRVLPSEAYEQWEAAALREMLTIRPKLCAAGFEFPIMGPVAVEAVIYRERNTGDLSNYLEAVGDFLQAAAIIADDRQIESWDGSRRDKDAANPRVEIFIAVLADVPMQIALVPKTEQESR